MLSTPAAPLLLTTNKPVAATDDLLHQPRYRLPPASCFPSRDVCRTSSILLRFRYPPRWRRMSHPGLLLLLSSSNSRLLSVLHARPFVGRLLRLVWPLLTSANPSRRLSAPAAQGRLTDLPGNVRDWMVPEALEDIINAFSSRLWRQSLHHLLAYNCCRYQVFNAGPAGPAFRTPGALGGRHRRASTTSETRQ